MVNGMIWGWHGRVSKHIELCRERARPNSWIESSGTLRMSCRYLFLTSHCNQRSSSCMLARRPSHETCNLPFFSVNVKVSILSMKSREWPPEQDPPALMGAILRIAFSCFEADWYDYSSGAHQRPSQVHVKFCVLSIAKVLEMPKSASKQQHDCLMTLAICSAQATLCKSIYNPCTHLIFKYLPRLDARSLGGIAHVSRWGLSPVQNGAGETNKPGCTTLFSSTIGPLRLHSWYWDLFACSYSLMPLSSLPCPHTFRWMGKASIWLCLWQAELHASFYLALLKHALHTALFMPTLCHAISVLPQNCRFGSALQQWEPKCTSCYHRLLQVWQRDSSSTFTN